MQIFGTTTVADFITGLLAVLTANIGVIVGILAFSVGVAWVTRHFSKATKGRL